MLFAFTLYVVFGAVAGLIAGLLGLGGGIVLVPMLNYAFTMTGLPADSNQILSVATSMSCIVFTSMVSTRAHHRQGGVDWHAWRQIAPGILVGTFGGTALAPRLPTHVLKLFFIAFLLFVCVQMLAGLKPKATRHLPGKLGSAAVGGGIGLVSSLVGIGGGTLSVPFLTLCNTPFRMAIGTSAALGLPIALAGTVGYIINGWGVADLPPYTLGYVYLPACLGVVLASTMTAGFGARLAHKLPVDRLKRIFACFLVIVAVDMIRTLW